MLLVKKGASVLLKKNMCINLVLKIQQSKNKYHFLALHNFITTGESARKCWQRNQGAKPRHRGKKATEILPKSFHTWRSHFSSAWVTQPLVKALTGPFWPAGTLLSWEKGLWPPPPNWVQSDSPIPLFYFSYLHPKALWICTEHILRLESSGSWCLERQLVQNLKGTQRFFLRLLCSKQQDQV